MKMFRVIFAAALAALVLTVMSFCVLADIEADGKIIIAIDPGHGGIDGGTDVGTYPEKYYNFKLSEYLRDALLEDGRFTVVMTRDDDVYIKYFPRVITAAMANADLIISMHCNTIYESYVNGSSAYVSLIDRFNASDLAGQLLTAIEGASGIRAGRVQTRSDTGDSYGVYYWSYEHQWDMPGASYLGQISDYYSINTCGSKMGIRSIIIEHGYLSNPSDLSKLDNDDTLRAIARAEADAIIQYYTGHEHVFGEYETDFPSNCMFTGTESRRCAICGAKSGTRPLPEDPDNHFWRETSKTEATCETDGYASYVCQITFNLNHKGYDCDVHEYSEVIPAYGHDYVTIEDSQPTHAVPGRLYMRCSRCGKEIVEMRYGEGHDFAVTRHEDADCEHDGFTEYTCTVCGETKTETEPALGHDYQVTSESPATHLEDGYVTRTCSRCGAEETEIIPAEGHSPVQAEDGSTYCSVCGEPLSPAETGPGEDTDPAGLGLLSGAHTFGYYLAMLIIIIFSFILK